MTRFVKQSLLLYSTRIDCMLYTCFNSPGHNHFASAELGNQTGTGYQPQCRSGYQFPRNIKGKEILVYQPQCRSGYQSPRNIKGMGNWDISLSAGLDINLLEIFKEREYSISALVQVWISISQKYYRKEHLRTNDKRPFQD